MTLYTRPQVEPKEPTSEELEERIAMFNLDDLDQYEYLLGRHQNDPNKPKVMNVVREELKEYLKKYNSSHWENKIDDVKRFKMVEVYNHWFSYYLKTLTTSELEYKRQIEQEHEEWRQKNQEKILRRLQPQVQECNEKLKQYAMIAQKRMEENLIRWKRQNGESTDGIPFIFTDPSKFPE
ncbi:hypothetical protein TRFO_42091 [Tritrichomonas foetus]|uniref:Uncharacterized protein n=1 Tax=Tritrichomonas foetus TaxID=1144522 RepID=A0A1J4KXT6_9EUKA|nr:hypothetical protein TRFO_42091 [Tritrichomonas foetus]|eukprot:OHT16067.1 hypothetical protein TRFO_42091 [Tritrichomonas foetus]